MHTHGHIRMALRFAIVALSALACFFSGSALAEEKSDDASVLTYRSNVSEVRVTFFVTDNDESDHPLETLSKADFAVVDSERIIRSFRSFGHSDETSLDVVALVDLSESVAPRFRTAMNQVLRLVAREQSIGDDNISVLSFGGNRGGILRGSGDTRASDTAPAILCADGCRSPDAMVSLLSAQAGGATPLYDALIFASDFIAQRRRNSVRPVVILFSDGADTISLHSRGEALAAVCEAGALIYSVDLGTSKPQELRRDSYFISGGVFLRQVSEASGGRYFSFPQGGSQLDAGATVLNAALDDLRASFVVTYDLPSREAGFHSLRILPTHNRKLTFHSRNGYDYEPSR